MRRFLPCCSRLALVVAVRDASNTIEHKAQRATKKTGRKTMDQVLGEVMTEAMKARDRGDKPDMDFVYKRSQEKLYEAEHGQAPPSKNAYYKSHIPFAPQAIVRRLIPLDLFESDPWPQRSHARGLDEEGAIPPWEPAKVENSDGDMVDNPVLVAAAAHGKLEAERAGGGDPAAGFIDALDELAYWELKYLEFIRTVPVSQRRSLPLFQDRYKHLTHRLHRAEGHFIRCRDRALAPTRASPAAFAASEDRISRCRFVYIETHKSYTHANYDPTRMKKAFTGKILQMTNEQFEVWKDEDRAARLQLIEAFSNVQSHEPATADKAAPAS